MTETTIAIIGMIAAFITASVTAFLAEPVKTYFQTKSDLKNLRIALYKEMYFNYQLISSWVQVLKNDNTFDSSTLRNTVRRECYKHAIQNQTSLFYRLNETDAINHLQGASLGTLYSYLETGDREISKQDRDLLSMSEGYVEIFEHNCYEGTFDRKLLKTIMPNAKYQDVWKRGETLTLSLKNQKESQTGNDGTEST